MLIRQCLYWRWNSIATVSIGSHKMMWWTGILWLDLITKCTVLQRWMKGLSKSASTNSWRTCCSRSLARPMCTTKSWAWSTCLNFNKFGRRWPHLVFKSFFYDNWSCICGVWPSRLGGRAFFDMLCLSLFPSFLQILTHYHQPFSQLVNGTPPLYLVAKVGYLWDCTCLFCKVADS